MLIALVFKILFKIPFFRKRYFGFYKKLFKPRNLFRGLTSICRFDTNLKIKADLDEWIQQHIYFLGTWDERGIKFLKNNLKKADVFFDIGANIGAYSLVASKIVGTDGQVHSFEPVSEVFERFQYNIKLNGLINITANRNAVYQSSEVLDLFVSSKENAGMSSIFHHDTESGIIEKVQAITIDGYVEKMNIQRIDMIKIDIEGAELFALKGMKNTLSRFRPVIIMEFSEEVMKNSSVEAKDVLDLLKSLNYMMKRIYKCGNTGNITESKSDYTNFVFCQAD
jgi:FkbM family methyltransferase